MTDILFQLSPVLVPLAFGLVPAFLPPCASQLLRWGMWLVLLGLGAWYGLAMRDEPAAFRMIAWLTVAASALLSLIVLIAETGRPHRAHHP